MRRKKKRKRRGRERERERERERGRENYLSDRFCKNQNEAKGWRLLNKRSSVDRGTSSQIFFAHLEVERRNAWLRYFKPLAFRIFAILSLSHVIEKRWNPCSLSSHFEGRRGKYFAVFVFGFCSWLWGRKKSGALVWTFVCVQLFFVLSGNSLGWRIGRFFFVFVSGPWSELAGRKKKRGNAAAKIFENKMGWLGFLTPEEKGYSRLKQFACKTKNNERTHQHKK